MTLAQLKEIIDSANILYKKTFKTEKDMEIYDIKMEGAGPEHEGYYEKFSIYAVGEVCYRGDFANKSGSKRQAYINVGFDFEDGKIVDRTIEIEEDT